MHVIYSPTHSPLHEVCLTDTAAIWLPQCRLICIVDMDKTDSQPQKEQQSATHDDTYCFGCPVHACLNEILYIIFIDKSMIGFNMRGVVTIDLLWIQIKKHIILMSHWKFRDEVIWNKLFLCSLCSRKVDYCIFPCLTCNYSCYRLSSNSRLIFCT